MTRILANADSALLAVNRWAVILSLAAMSCIVFANVTLRYLTNNSITWSEEVARYLMIYMTFLSAGLALRSGMLVAISNLHGRFSPAITRILRLAILAILVIFCGWMIYAGMEYVNRMGRQVTPATRVSFYYIYLAMPIGFGLMAVHILIAASLFLTQGRFDPETENSGSAVSG